jgi:hypothetical protein
MRIAFGGRTHRRVDRERAGRLTPAQVKEWAERESKQMVIADRAHAATPPA